MEAIYRSRHGDIFTYPLEALYNDAESGAFTMYDKSGEITTDLNECCFVCITNSKGIDDFDKFREDWRRWMNSAKDGYVDEGVSMWNEREGYWSDPIPRRTFITIAANLPC